MPKKSKKRQSEQQLAKPKTKKGKEEADSDSDLSENGETINLDIEFFDPKPDDFHPIKNLLLRYMDKRMMRKDEVSGLSNLVELIVNQTNVGTVIKVDESIFGFITVLNVQKHKDELCMKQLFRYLLGKCPNRESKEGIAKLRDGPESLGLIICERVVNFPHQVAGPLYSVLFDEIARAQTDEPTQQLRDSFKFDNYLILSNGYEEVKEDEEGEGKKKKKGKKKAAGIDELELYKVEDHVLLNSATLKFAFKEPPFPDSTDYQYIFDKTTERYRIVMVVPDKADVIKEQITQLVEKL